MNFTGVYDYESFSHNPKFAWIDCTHLQGVECYCDKDGASALKKSSKTIRQKEFISLIPATIII